MSALLDTHVLVWWVNGDRQLSRAQNRAIARADASDPLLLSDISLWEIATLHELGRLELRLPIREWLERAAAPPLVRRIGLSPAIAAEVASVPPEFHRDPADRIIIASARVLGVDLLTSDGRIVDSSLVATVS